MSDTRLKLKIFISLSSLTFKNINKICQNISASSNKLNYLYIFCPILSFSPEAFIKSHQRLDTQAYTLYLPFRPFWRRKNYKKKKSWFVRVSLENEGIIVHVYYCVGYKIVYVCHNLQYCTDNVVEFIIYKLYLIKFNLDKGIIWVL